MERLTVAVLTYQRPEQLRAGLPLILEQVVDVQTVGVEADILVVDNDPTGSAETIVSVLSSDRVRYVVEAKPGISAARNRALAEAAESDLLVFIDDDERPRENWLGELISMWRDTHAAAVTGLVISEFDGELDPWIAAGRFFHRARRPSGTNINVAATNNLLLDMRQVGHHQVEFDNRFGLIGGEDTLFSRSLSSRGARIVWCGESIVTDVVPVSRMTRRWVLARAWSHGNSAALVEVHLSPCRVRRLRTRVTLLAGGLARIAGGGGRFVAGLLLRSPRHQARGLRALCRGAGFVAGGMGIAYLEYGRSAGRLRRLEPRDRSTPPAQKRGVRTFSQHGKK